MASTNHTTNYDLPQWVKTDAFKMEDFNDAFQKIDTAIKGAKDDAANAADAAAAGVKIVTGTYTGDGTQNRTISLSFAPRAVIVWCHGYYQFNDYIYGGIAMPGTPCSSAIVISGNGFCVAQGGSSRTNENTAVYTYLAVA